MGTNTLLQQDFGRWSIDGIYKDEGCVIHNQCLTCPLPQCVYGNTAKVNRAIAFPLINSTTTREQLSESAGVSVRTAQKFLVRYHKVGGDFNEFLGVDSDGRMS